MTKRKLERGSWAEFYEETKQWLEWFNGEVPRCAAEFAQHFGLSKRETSSQLRRFLSREWLVEEKAGSYSMVRKPTFDEFVTPFPVDQSIEVFWVDYELLTFFNTPKTAAEYQGVCKKSILTVRGVIQHHLGAERLWRAGKTQGAAGAPAQLYCSDRALARRAFWTWLLAEGEVERSNEQVDVRQNAEIFQLRLRVHSLEQTTERLHALVNVLVVNAPPDACDALLAVMEKAEAEERPFVP